MSEWGYVGVAYGLTWLTLIGYGIYLGSRVRRARRLLERTTREVER